MWLEFGGKKLGKRYEKKLEKKKNNIFYDLQKVLPKQGFFRGQIRATSTTQGPMTLNKP